MSDCIDLRKAERSELVDHIDRLEHHLSLDRQLIQTLADLLGLDEDEFMEIVQEVGEAHEARWYPERAFQDPDDETRH